MSGKLEIEVLLVDLGSKLSSNHFKNDSVRECCGKENRMTTICGATGLMKGNHKTRKTKDRESHIVNTA